MSQDIQQLVDSYHDWLKDKTSLRRIENWIEITTPYLDRHNDYIQIYAKKNGEGFILTDDGYTITDLEQSGYNLNESNRDILKVITNGFAIENDGNVLQVHATSESFSLCQHNLVQAILAVNDMFYLVTPRSVPNVFYKDVVTWLKSADVTYKSRDRFKGQTGYIHTVDFVIPKSDRHPQRILHTIGAPDRGSVGRVVLSWFDTREEHFPESRAYVMLNDSVQAIPRGVTGALQNYDMRPIRWTRREDARAELAA